MKKIIALALAAAFSMAAFAQEKQGTPVKHHGQKIESQKIAFITEKMNLTVEEAQAFWPLYNEAEAAQKKINQSIRQSLKALNQAMKEKLDEKEISKLLDEYVSALSKQKNVHTEYLAKYKKAVGVEKTAKFYRAYESFRRQQINNLRGGHGGPGYGKRGPAAR